MSEPAPQAPTLIRRDESFLLIVDLQEKLLPAIERAERVIANAQRLITAAERLDVPIFATEHCADRIGVTVEALRHWVPQENIIDKQHFSAAAETGVLERLGTQGRRRPVILGTEAPVCVLQTTLGLAAAGYAATIVTDAVSSRFPEDREVALQRFAAAAVTLATTEMVIFEWLERGDDPAFRDLLPVIKDSPG